MKCLFQIKVFILLSSLYGFSVATSIGNHLFCKERIELVENFHSFINDTTKSITLFSTDNRKNLPEYSALLKFDVLELLRLQSILYLSFKNTKETTYIISHQTNLQPQYLID